MPPTHNPHIETVATLYEKEKYAEAQSRLEKALAYEGNGTQERVWIPGPDLRPVPE